MDSGFQCVPLGRLLQHTGLFRWTAVNREQQQPTASLSTSLEQCKRSNRVPPVRHLSVNSIPQPLRGRLPGNSTLQHHRHSSVIQGIMGVSTTPKSESQPAVGMQQVGELFAGHASSAQWWRLLLRPVYYIL